MLAFRLPQEGKGASFLLREYRYAPRRDRVEDSPAGGRVSPRTKAKPASRPKTKALLCGSARRPLNERSDLSNERSNFERVRSGPFTTDTFGMRAGILSRTMKLKVCARIPSRMGFFHRRKKGMSAWILSRAIILSASLDPFTSDKIECALGAFRERQTCKCAWIISRTTKLKASSNPFTNDKGLRQSESALSPHRNRKEQ